MDIGVPTVGSLRDFLSAFGALRHRDFRLIWIGLNVSSMGAWMQTLGIGWYVVQLAVREGNPERTPLYLGLVGATRGVPGLLLGPVSGAIADRVDRRRLLILTQAVSACAATVLAILTLLDLTTLPVVLLTSIASASALQIDTAARMAMVPRLVPPESFSSAVGLNLTSSNLASLLGPLLGGALIIPFGVAGLLVVHALSFVPILGALVVIAPQPTVGGPGDRSGILASIVEGYLYVWRDPVIRPMFVLMALSALTARPYQQLLPAVAHDVLRVGAVELSWLLGAAGIGAFLGSLVVASLGMIRRRGLLVVASVIVFGASVSLFALQRSLLPALVLIVLVSLSMQVHIGTHITIYQSRTPHPMIGRVVGTSATIVLSFMPLGSLLVGWIATLIGTDAALVWSGALLAAIGVVTLVRSEALRTLRQEAAHSPMPSTH